MDFNIDDKVIVSGCKLQGSIAGVLGIMEDPNEERWYSVIFTNGHEDHFPAHEITLKES